MHRVGKKAEDRCRPIIARFVCREDRDRVWLERGNIKQSTTYSDAHITEEYARAIQDERKKVNKSDDHGLKNAKLKVDVCILTRTGTIMRIFLVS